MDEVATSIIFYSLLLVWLCLGDVAWFPDLSNYLLYSGPYPIETVAKPMKTEICFNKKLMQGKYFF